MEEASGEVERPPSASPSAIVVSGLGKSFGNFRALVDVSFEVQFGEVVALLGPNGAGKSTLVRILGTTVLPDEGSAAVAGFDVTAKAREVRRSTGLVLSDERSFYWRLTGRENLEFFASLSGLRGRRRCDRIDTLLSTVGLTDAADRRFDGYSAGMRARLSLARALLAAPRVLLLDEPTRSLDPVAAIEIRNAVRSLADARGVGVLLVSHDLHEAAVVADRALVMREGRLSHIPHTNDAAILERSMMEHLAEP